MDDFFEPIEYQLQHLNPLTQGELAPEQLRLLQTIIYPTVREGRDHTARWPVWDYVKRSMEQRDHRDVEDLVDGLPWVVKPDGQPYGLIWRSNGRSAVRIQPTETVGLTIPGIRHVNSPIADQLSWLVARYANAEANLPLDPWVAATGSLDFEDQAKEVMVPPSPPLIGQTGITIPAAGAVLLHEFVPFTTETGRLDSITGLKQMEVRIGMSRLAAFHGIESALDYADAVWQESLAAVKSGGTMVTQSFATVLDYLDLALRDDPRWPKNLRLTGSIDLQSMETISKEVGSGAEFESAVGALWNILSKLRSPAVTQNELDDAGLRSAGSINSLDIWLRRALTGDISRALTGRTGASLQAIRSVGRIRQGFVHGSSDTRAKSAQALRELGVNPIAVDWSMAWPQLRAVTATAFDAIREAVQHSGAATNTEPGGNGG